MEVRDRQCRMGRTRVPVAALLMVLMSTGANPGEVLNPHAHEEIGTVRQVYDGALELDIRVNTFRNIDRLFPSRRIPASTDPLPLPLSGDPLGPVTVQDGGDTYTLEDFLELNRIAGLLVIQGGEIKLERYRYGNTDATRWMSMQFPTAILMVLLLTRRSREASVHVQGSPASS